MNRYSICGIDCHNCRHREEQGCPGCQASEGKVFWGECELYFCNRQKGQEHCGLCREFPCAKLKEWASGENPERIDNLKGLSS